MLITKQIDDRHFEVELEDSDFKQELAIVVAHDYVRFFDNPGLQAKSGVELHTVNTCTNWIPMRQSATIGIRDIVKFVLPYLTRHKYCQEEHIKDNYMFSPSAIQYSNDGEKLIAVRAIGDEDFTHIPLSVYNSIKNGLL